MSSFHAVANGPSCEFANFLWCCFLKGTNNVVDSVLRIAEEHRGVLVEEQRILHTGIARRHGALEHDHVVGVPSAQHRHTGDRASRISLSRRVHRVIRADPGRPLLALASTFP